MRRSSGTLVALAIGAALAIVAVAMVWSGFTVGQTVIGAGPAEVRALIVGLIAGGLTMAWVMVGVRAMFDRLRTQRLTKVIEERLGSAVVRYESPVTVTVTGDAGRVLELLARVRDAGPPYAVTVRAPRIDPGAAKDIMGRLRQEVGATPPPVEEGEEDGRRPV